MKTIATLTMNPTIDVDYEIDRLIHTHKMRTSAERYAPGGGGINVTRVFVRMGGNARCYYLSGGATGPALDGLIDLHQMVRTRIPIAGHTRVATNTLERESGKEYRFVPAGPVVHPEEWRKCLEILAKADCDMLVASGSLPPGVPTDFYAQIIRIMHDRGVAIVLDTSGEPLKAGLEQGGILLVKPSQEELQHLVGRPLETVDAIGEAASAIVARGQAEMVAVTMGGDGALLATANGTFFLPAVRIEAKSAVGAGDSFVAAMVHALARDLPPIEAFRHGMAAGAAAVMTAGTDLAHPADIERLLAHVPSP